MRNCITILLVIWFASGTLSKALASTDYIIIEQDARKGLADEDGNVLIPALYDDIGWSDGNMEVSSNVIGFRDGKNWGLINVSNKIVAPAKYSTLFKANEQVIIAAKKGQFSQRDFYGLIDYNGLQVKGFLFTELIRAGNRIIGIYRDGVQFFYGLLDNKGNVVIPFEYKKISKISESLFLVMNEANRNSIFSKEGQDITGFIIDGIQNKSGYHIISSLGKVGVVNKGGEIIFPPQFAEVFIDGSEPKALTISKWNILNQKGQSIDEFQIETLEPYSTGSWKISGIGYEGIMTVDGEMLTNHEISSIGKLQDDVSYFESFGKFGLIRSNGEVIINPRFDSLIYSDGFVYGKVQEGRESGWVVMDSFAITKSKVLYEDIRPYYNHVFAVKKKGKWGFVNRIGKELVACVYDEVGVPKEGLVEVKFHGEYGVINLNNEWIVLPKKYPVEIVGDSLFILKNPYQNSLHTFGGEMIYFTNYTLKNEGRYLSELNRDSVLWFLDFGGRIVDQTSPMTIVDYDDGNITIVRRNSKLGAMDNTGRIIIGFNNDYDELLPPSEEFFGIRKDGAYGFIDFNNKLRIANRYEGIKPYKKGLAAVKLRDKWGFIDKKENLVIQPVYDQVESFDHLVSIVKKDDLFGLLRPDGGLEQNIEYDSIARQPDGRYFVLKGNKLGLLNEEGRMALYPKFDQIHDTGTGYLIIRRSGKYGIIADNGVSLIPPIYDDLLYDKEKGVYLAKTNGVWLIK